MSFIVRPSLLRAVGTAPALRAASRPMAFVQRRMISTQKVSDLEALKLLNQQRVARPRSPDLQIYAKQLTAVLSAFHRMTGVALAGGFYLFSLAYLLHPIYPSIDSAHLIEWAHELPAWAKATAKLAVAAPLTYHTFNGVRHLFWDLGKGLAMKPVYASGYTVLAATAISTLYLVFGI